MNPCSGSDTFLSDDLAMDECTSPLLSTEGFEIMTCTKESNAGTQDCEMVVFENDWVRVCSGVTTHNIFLSHSGAQKDFVEQLCEDLERAGQFPFFDKRINSLPKGEEFAARIFKAAEECELAIVVVSEEYFTRSKWPLQELVALQRSPGCKILPLFFGISCREYKNPERRHRWYQVWDEWAKSDTRILSPTWKKAVRELDGRNGMEYSQALGEVQFRKEVVTIVTSLTTSQDKVMQVDSADSIPTSTLQDFSVSRALSTRTLPELVLLMLPSSMVEHTSTGELLIKTVWGYVLSQMLQTALIVLIILLFFYISIQFAFKVFFPLTISMADKFQSDNFPGFSSSSRSFPGFPQNMHVQLHA